MCTLQPPSRYELGNSLNVRAQTANACALRVNGNRRSGIAYGTASDRDRVRESDTARVHENMAFIIIRFCTAGAQLNERPNCNDMIQCGAAVSLYAHVFDVV